MSTPLTDRDLTEIRNLRFDSPSAEAVRTDLLAEVERLKTRLAAAEMVCLAYGAAPARPAPSDREKALFELWWEWTEIAQPDYSVHGPLIDELITKLAARRDEKRAAALARVRKLVGGETP